MGFHQFQRQFQRGHRAAKARAGQENELPVLAGGQRLAPAGCELLIGGADAVGRGVFLLAIKAKDEIGIQLLDQLGAERSLGFLEIGNCLG